jgi:hypothetical protein
MIPAGAIPDITVTVGGDVTVSIALTTIRKGPVIRDETFDRPLMGSTCSGSRLHYDRVPSIRQEQTKNPSPPLVQLPGDRKKMAAVPATSALSAPVVRCAIVGSG